MNVQKLNGLPKLADPSDWKQEQELIPDDETMAKMEASYLADKERARLGLEQQYKLMRRGRENRARENGKH